MLDVLWAVISLCARFAVPVAVTWWFLLRLSRIGWGLRLPIRLTESRLARDFLRRAPVLAGACIVIWLARKPGIVWLSPGVAWIALLIAAAGVVPLTAYCLLLLRLRREPGEVRGSVVCAGVEYDLGNSQGWPFAHTPRKVAATDFRWFLGGDLRRVDDVRGVERLVGLPVDGVAQIPHFRLSEGEHPVEDGSPALNRYLNARLSPALWEMSRDLCRLHPRAVARAWKRFHAEPTVGGRLQSLYRTADLVQKEASVVVLAAVLQSGRLREAVATRPFLRTGQLGEWNGTVERVLASLGQSGTPEVLRPLAHALTNPRGDYEELMARLDPFWTLMDRPHLQGAPNTLRALRVLWHLRNLTVGHGAVGWAMTMEPAPFLSALHGFLVQALLPLAGIDFGVYAWREGQIIGCDRGLGLVDTEECVASSLALGKDVPLTLEPFFFLAGGRLLMLHRIRKEAEYLDPEATAGEEEAFVSLSVPPDSFLDPSA